MTSSEGEPKYEPPRWCSIRHSCGKGWVGNARTHLLWRNSRQNYLSHFPQFCLPLPPSLPPSFTLTPGGLRLHPHVTGEVIPWPRKCTVFTEKASLHFLFCFSFSFRKAIKEIIVVTANFSPLIFSAVSLRFFPFFPINFSAAEVTRTGGSFPSYFSLVLAPLRLPSLSVAWVGFFYNDIGLLLFGCCSPGQEIDYFFPSYF